ncbi:MAG: hypothetical protein OGMRLDGQ_002045 [Candidatus Fervidibacter sp.]|jgi:uncharacterized membrane protein AbrB (regulator of aidB expression)
MGWLAFALLLGIVFGLVVRLSLTVTRLLDCSLTVSLVIMLMMLGIEVAKNQKLGHAINSHVLSVVALLVSVSLVSVAWGWLLERGWSLPWWQR